MIENGVKLDKIESTEAKKSTLKKKEGKTHAVSYQEKAITHFTHDSQTGAISHTTNMQKAVHKGITSPTLGQWLVFLLCLHQLKGESLNHRASKKIMLEGQGLSRRGPSLTPFQ